ncbi:MAG: hypothetical protein Q4D56_06590 [Bacteroides sp.]|nr:hypothetical protein [Bacteroides sp.]
MDLTPYIPADNRWIQPTAEAIGWEKLREYYNRVFLMLLSLPRGGTYSITDNVAPENYDLFIKCLCTAMHEMYSVDRTASYYLEGTHILKR